GKLALGSLSDGFWQYYNNGTSTVPLYSKSVAGAGASGAATLFDPAASRRVQWFVRRARCRFGGLLPEGRRGYIGRQSPCGPHGGRRDNDWRGRAGQCAAGQLFRLRGHGHSAFTSTTTTPTTDWQV